MKHLLVALALTIGMVTAAVSAPVTVGMSAIQAASLPDYSIPTISLTQAVDSDKDPVETVLVVGVYLAGDASSVQHFTYHVSFQSRDACQKHQEDDEFLTSLFGFLKREAAARGPIGWNIRCMIKGTPL